ncbi:MAG: oligoendopeptidase F [Acidimicrobiales bacterium]|nr:MAG: oligoendopeptidase F [Acidimicrobiales bacterium]
MSPTDLTEAESSAADVRWRLDELLGGADPEALLHRADELADRVSRVKGRVAELTTDDLVDVMNALAACREALARAGAYAALRHAENSLDEERGALVAKVEEASTQIATKTLFFELEWVALDDETVERHLADERLEFCAHHLRSLRRYRDHLLSEAEERILAETSVVGSRAWTRLFEEITSELQVALEDPAASAAGLQTGTQVTLERALALLHHPDREVRRTAAESVSESLARGVRTRAFILNTIALDKAVEDRLRGYPTWLSSRNLENETSDQAVEALTQAVVRRYDIPARWYEAKARILGLDELADYDRMASVAATERTFAWSQAVELVLDAYSSFAAELAEAASRFFDEGWIDAPSLPGKRPGAFCHYTVPSHHPYILLNWTGRPRDVMTLAHELGHGVHAWLARDQGIFHQSSPLTLAETASVFGEALAQRELLRRVDDPDLRFSLLAEALEDSIATVFRQIAMLRFEDRVHTHRRESGELSVSMLAETWRQTQAEMLGPAVKLTEGYGHWWSYVPHFIFAPGYVYAYAFGQLFALALYARWEMEGEAFTPAYLELLRAGGSRPPAELGKIVDCDLEDPSFWDAGLQMLDRRLEATLDAARRTGRLEGGEP